MAFSRFIAGTVAASEVELAENVYDKVLARFPDTEDIFSANNTLDKCIYVGDFIKGKIDVDADCEKVVTKEHIYFIKRVESAIIFVLILNNVYSLPLLSLSNEQKAVVERISRMNYEAIGMRKLISAYSRFKFFNGTIERMIHDHGRQATSRTLSSFFDEHWSTNQFQHLSLLDSINYLLSENYNKSLTQLPCFVDQIKNNHNQSVYLVLVNGRNVIWSDLLKKETLILYNCMLDESYLSSKKAYSKINPSLSSITSVTLDNQVLERAITVYFDSEDGNDVTSYKMMVYKAQRVTCFILWKQQDITDPDLKKICLLLQKYIPKIEAELLCLTTNPLQIKLKSTFDWLLILNDELNVVKFIGGGGVFIKPVPTPHFISTLQQDIVLKHRYLDVSSKSFTHHVFLRVDRNQWMIICRHFSVTYFLVLNNHTSDHSEVKDNVVEIFRAFKSHGILDVDIMLFECD